MSMLPQKYLQNEDIVLISNQMLEDRYWTSKQYITQELVKANRVLYVEANYSFGKLLLGLLKGTWPVHPIGALKQKHDKLWVLTPFPRLPFRNHIRFMGWLNQKLLKMKIKTAIKEIGLEQSIMWTFVHQTADLVGKLGEKISIYHCVDDWPVRIAMEKMGSQSVVQSDENSLMKKVDVIFRVSEPLLAGRETVGAPVYLTPNGVDFDAFSLNRKEGFSTPEALASLPKPIFGFAGSIGEWVDADLIIRIAREFPSSSIVLIGAVDRPALLEKMNEVVNVHYLGLIPRAELPNFLFHFDVCLMPFTKSQIGQGLLPLKMFQYLAMGKPVIATSSPPLAQFGDVIRLASDSEDFIAEVNKSLDEDETIYKQRRISRAKEFSWENRVLAYSKILEEYKNSNRPPDMEKKG